MVVVEGKVVEWGCGEFEGEVEWNDQVSLEGAFSRNDFSYGFRILCVRTNPYRLSSTPRDGQEPTHQRMQHSDLPAVTRPIIIPSPPPNLNPNPIIPISASPNPILPASRNASSACCGCLKAGFGHPYAGRSDFSLLVGELADFQPAPEAAAARNPSFSRYGVGLGREIVG